MVTPNGFEIKAYSKRELAGLYGISVFTLMVWIDPFKIIAEERKKCSILTPVEVKKIVEKIGEP